LEVNHSIPFWDLVARLIQTRQPTYLYETTVNRTSINLKTGRLESQRKDEKTQLEGQSDPGRS